MYKIIGADGKEYGPVTIEQLRQWMAEGRVNAQTQVQVEGVAGWQPLASLPEFASAPLPLAPRPIVTEKVPNHLAPAILCTIFCCWPLGIPAIVFAARVNSKLAAGDLAGAKESSRKAKMWCWISVASGVAICLAYLIFAGLLMAGATLRHF